MSRRLLLCATDLSAVSRQTLATAVDLARAMEGRLLVVHVVDQEGPCIGVGQAVVHLPVREGRARGRQRLAEFIPAVADLPIEARLVEGDPAVEVLRLARERCCAAIVLGGSVGIRGAGQVAERILKAAPCPVILASGRGPVDQDDPLVSG
jgi:nucleotide-binding universal stress UspA family protein